MKNGGKKQFYIVCNYSDLNFYMGKKKEPLLLYEDGALEVESIEKFQDHTGGRYRKEWYKGIEQDMAELENPKRDLRDSFSPRDDFVTLLEILEMREPYKESFSRSELRKFMFERAIERRLYSAREAYRKLVSGRMTKAIKRKKEEDREFLKRIGYMWW